MEIVRYKAIVEELFQAWIPKEPISTQIGSRPGQLLPSCRRIASMTAAIVSTEFFLFK